MGTVDSLVEEYNWVSEKIADEKQQELDELVSDVVEIFQEEEGTADTATCEEKENTSSAADRTWKHNIAFASLYALHISLNYQMMQQGEERFENELKEDWGELFKKVQHLIGAFEEDEQVVWAVFDLLELIGNVPLRFLLKYTRYTHFHLKRVKRNFVEIMYPLFSMTARYFEKEDRKDISGSMIERMVELSRVRTSSEEHQDTVRHILMQWGDLCPEAIYRVCEKEYAYSYWKDSIYEGSFLWFYGVALENRRELDKAKNIFYQCYIIYRRDYGEEDWYTLVAKREYEVMEWNINILQNRKDPEHFWHFREFVDKTDGKAYEDVSDDLVQMIIGKTLGMLLFDDNNWKSWERYEHYLKKYETICDKYDDTSEPLLKRRLAYNYRGKYFSQTGEFPLAEVAFMQALQAKVPDGISQVVSDEEIKINLMTMYSVQRDIVKTVEILTELMEIMEKDADNTMISLKEQYRIYIQMVDLYLTVSDVEELEKGLEEEEEFLKESCWYLIEEPEQLEDCEVQAVLYILDGILLMIVKNRGTQEEWDLYRESLSLIEENMDRYGFNEPQKNFCYYVRAVAAWEFQEEDLEKRIQKALLAMEKYRNGKVQWRMQILNIASAYYMKSSDYRKAKAYLTQGLQEMTSVWQSAVRYLNDTRLGWIIQPVQLQFQSYYAMIRECESQDMAYERILQFKALASLAGKERNKFLKYNLSDNEELKYIHDLQNQIAAMETNSMFRDDLQNVEELEEELRRREDEFVAHFPAQMHFTEITLEKVRQGMPQHSVVVEYFVGAQTYGKRAADTISDEELILDIYILKKEKDACTLHRETLVNAGEILDCVQQFVEILQAKSNQSASLEQLEQLEDIRELLFQILVQPVLPYIKNADTVYFAPDNYLVNLPFGILEDEDGEYLGDRYKIIEIESARDFLYNGNEVNSDGTLIIGNPAYEVRERESFSIEDADQGRSLHLTDGKVQQLPFTEVEISQLSARTGDRYYSGMLATKQRVLSAKGYRNIHIATHGYFDLKMEMESMYASCLLFAGVNNWLETGKLSEKYGNGILTADEVSRLDLHDTELVVLSSCLGGMNEAIFIGKSLDGMVGAFSAAGVHYVISHLWEADDLSTTIFMDAFYEEYLEKNASPPVALDMAKRYIRNLTVRQMREQGWFERLRELDVKPEIRERLCRYEQAHDRLRPFKSEEYWGGFVCYQCRG